MNEPNLDAAKIQKVAAANLSQLSFYVPPGGGNSYAELPNNMGSIVTIIASLRVLGFNLEDKAETREVGVVGQPLEDVDMALNSHGDRGKAPALFFSESGVQKLIAGGVETPTLDAVKGRVPAAQSHIR